MIRLAVAAVFAVFLCLQAVQGQEITSKKIHQDVLVVSGAGGNVTAFRTDEGILVVDAFFWTTAAEEARRQIEEAFPGVPITYLINTHYHFDHTAGNMIFEDVLIIAHINNSDRVRTDYAERAEQLAGAKAKIEELEGHAAKHAGSDSEDAEAWQEELDQMKKTYARYGDFKLVPAPFSLEKGARIELAEKTFHIWHQGAGHTDGDLIIFNPETRVLVMGDLLFNKNLPYIDVPAGSNIPNWIAILQKMILKSTMYDIVVPGHGEVGTVEALQMKVHYLNDLWAEVSAAHASGKTLEETLEEITMEKYSDWGRFSALKSNIEAVWTMLNKK